MWFADVVQRPEAVDGCVPVTDEERADILYKPQEDEWGGRSREEECARIVAGIDQLITVGMCAVNTAELTLSSMIVLVLLSRRVRKWHQTYLFFHTFLYGLNRYRCTLFWPSGPCSISYLLYCNRLPH